MFTAAKIFTTSCCSFVIWDIYLFLRNLSQIYQHSIPQMILLTSDISCGIISRAAHPKCISSCWKRPCCGYLTFTRPVFIKIYYHLHKYTIRTFPPISRFVYTTSLVQWRRFGWMNDLELALGPGELHWHHRVSSSMPKSHSSTTVPPSNCLPRGATSFPDCR